MASGTASVRVSLSIVAGTSGGVSLGNSGSFDAAVANVLGPLPGAVTVPVGGKVISFGDLVEPALCFMANFDETNYVEYGIYDPGTNVFYPLGELGPQECFVLRFSRNIREEYQGTGTGTTSPGNQFFMKANTADCSCVVMAFER